MSNIEWTDETWNPVTGCSKVSAGCKNCYAEGMTNRLKAMGLEKYKSGFSNVTTHEDELRKPYKWRKERMVFVNSMSDLFHKDVPNGFISKVFQTMYELPWHTFQVLTKRPERLREFSPIWTDNIWMGTSVEDQKVVHRIDELRACKAHTKFLSVEPLLGPLPNLDLTGIDWVIVGGESGAKARPMRYEWVADIRDQCIAQGVPFFFKQWGGKNKKKAGRLLDGREWNQYPEGVLA